jgi:hypothetical protein
VGVTSAIRGILTALAGLCFLCALLSGWMFYELYWRLRDCFDEAGRCLIPEGAVLSVGNSVWGLFAAIALLLALTLWKWSRRIS